MAVPSIDLLPNPPLPTDPEDVFDAKAGASLTAQQAMVPQINDSLTWIGQQVTAVDGYRQAAATSATNAANSASAANSSKSAAAQSATDATTNGAAQVQLAAQQVALANQARDSAQTAAAAAGAAAGLPSLTGNARKPLAPNTAANGVNWSDEISIPKYIDKMSTSSASGSKVLDLSLFSVFDISLAGNVTLSFSNIPTLTVFQEALTIVVRIGQASTPYSVTWFSGITWLTTGAVAPATPAANQIIEYVLSTTGTGGTWFGRVGAST